MARSTDSEEAIRATRPAIALTLIASIVAMAAVNAQPRFALTAATVEAVRNYPYFFRGRPVTIVGSVTREGDRYTLTSDTGSLEIESSEAIAEGRRELQGYVSDNLTMRVTSVTPPQLVADAAAPPLRAVVLEPAAYVGQVVTVVGQFRGRNLFADVPENPSGRRDDFVVRAGDASIWISGTMARGKDFALDPSSREHAGQWVSATGTVRYARGLVWLDASSIALSDPPEASTAAIAMPAPPPAPLEVFFSAPVQGELDVRGDAHVRIQFSRNLDPASLTDRIRVSQGESTAIEFSVRYDGATRAIEIVPNAPFERFREIKVELLEGIRSVEGGLLKPWTLTFSTGGPHHR